MEVLFNQISVAKSLRRFLINNPGVIILARCNMGNLLTAVDINQIVRNLAMTECKIDKIENINENICIYRRENTYFRSNTYIRRKRIISRNKREN